MHEDPNPDRDGGPVRSAPAGKGTGGQSAKNAVLYEVNVLAITQTLW